MTSVVFDSVVYYCTQQCMGLFSNCIHMDLSVYLPMMVSMSVLALEEAYPTLNRALV